jgi:hypothetical protein
VLAGAGGCRSNSFKIPKIFMSFFLRHKFHLKIKRLVTEGGGKRRREKNGVWHWRVHVRQPNDSTSFLALKLFRFHRPPQHMILE